MKTHPKKATLTPSFLFPIVVSLGVSLFMAERGNASTITWDGGGTSNTSGNWSTAANWNPDTTGGPAVSDTATLGDVSTGTRTITYDAGASGSLNTLTFAQTSAATNSLLLNSNLTVTNSGTLGALAGGTSSITISPTGATQGITLKIPTLNVNSGGSLIFSFGANTSSVPQTLSGNLTIAGGSVKVLTPNTSTAYGEITGTLNMTSGSIYLGGDSSHGGRLQIDGNFTASGGSITTQQVNNNGSSMLTLRGAVNSITGVALDTNTTITLANGSQSLTTDQALNWVNLRDSGIKTITSTNANHTVGGIQFWASGATTLQMGSDLKLAYMPAVLGTGYAFTIDANGHTLDLTGPNATYAPNNTGVTWSLNSSAVGGVIKAMNFDLSGASNTALSVGANMTLQSSGTGVTNNLGGTNTTINAASTLLCTGPTSLLVSNKTIGNLTVGNGIGGSLVQISTADITAAGTLTVAASGTLDLNGLNLSGAGLNGVNGAVVANNGGVAKTLSLTGTGTYSYAGIVGGGANLSLNKTGSGTQILSGASTYTGATTVSAGELDVNGSIATGAVGVNIGATLAGTGTVNGAVTTSGTIAGSLTFGNDVTVNNGATASASAFNSNIVDNGTITSAVKVQGGKTLSGTGSVTSGVTVQSGGKTSAGNGSSTGVLTLDLTYNSGATANFNVSSTASSGSPTALKSGLSYSRVAVTGSAGAVNLQIGTGTAASQIQGDGSSNSGVALELTLSVGDFAKLTSNATNNYQAGQSNSSVDNYFVFTLGSGLVDGRFQTLELTVGGIEYTGTIYYSGTNDRYNGVSNLGDVIVDGQEFAVSYTGDASTNSVTGGYDLVLTAIPEPGAWVMTFAGLGSLIGFQRMRRRMKM